MLEVIFIRFLRVHIYKYEMAKKTTKNKTNIKKPPKKTIQKNQQQQSNTIYYMQGSIKNYLLNIYRLKHYACTF